jgi:hypothetical protein
MVGEELRKLGVGAVYSVDIIPEAAHAPHRDRPGVYDGYLTADLTTLTPDQRATLVDADLNTMTVVSALGFAGVPLRAFAQAYNLISRAGSPSPSKKTSSANAIPPASRGSSSECATST